MNTQAAAENRPATMPMGLRRAGALLAAVALRTALAATLLAAWLVSRGNFYTPASDLGYWLGVAGGSLMLALLVYPLRKRFRALSLLGPLRHWFRFHLVAGIAGPLIVLFHSTFRVGSFNAAIALASMLLVVASGIVGRYLYRKIHHGLYGSRATLEELRATLARQVEALAPLLARVPEAEREIARYLSLVSHQPAGRWAGALHFASLGGRRLLAGFRIRRALGRQHGHSSVQRAALRDLGATIDATLSAVQRTAQFATYEKLFSLWHVVHIPFLCMLVITAVIHVVAVHAY